MMVSESFLLQLIFEETGIPAIDTAPPAGLVQNCITTTFFAISCLALWPHVTNQHLLPG